MVRFPALHDPSVQTRKQTVRLFAVFNMSDESQEVSILLADVSGSTSLYEQTGNTEALAQISRFLGEIRRTISREGGRFIHSKGDDVLCTFDSADSALRAAEDILNKNLKNKLSVHAGLHHGEVIQTVDDIFGDCVNVCARLASLANPGEVLISQYFVDRLSADRISSLNILGDRTFKGKDEPIRVYTLLADGTSLHTQIGVVGDVLPEPVEQSVEIDICVQISYGGQTYKCYEKNSITFGRSEENDIVVDQPWVSRQHATISVLRNKAQLVDRSSGGTFIVMGRNPEIPVLRETVLLIGSGTISPTLPTANGNAEIITFNVVAAS